MTRLNIDDLDAATQTEYRRILSKGPRMKAPSSRLPKIIYAGILAASLTAAGITLASAATIATTLGDNTSHTYTCNHSAPISVSGQTASSVNVACGARPVSTTTTTQPTTTTTQPTTTTTQPTTTTTTTQPTTTTTQPSSGQVCDRRPGEPAG